MKKLLSVFLAILMVFSTVAFAVPSAVTVGDTAEEVPVSDEAELMGAGYKVQRGINMLTGTKEALTGENYSTYGGIFSLAYDDPTISQTVNPEDANDKVFVYNLPGNPDNPRGGNYVNFSVQFGPYQSSIGAYPALSNYIDHPYFYFNFDYMKEVVDESLGYTAGDQAWLMTKTSSSNYAFLDLGGRATPTNGWQHISGIYNLTLKNQQTAMDYTDPNNIFFHFYVAKDNGSDVNFYYDNMIIAPAYKVTYYNAAGDTVIKEDYVAADEEGNLLTTFEPQGFLAGGTTYSGWSYSVGGDVVSSISLDESNNADIVLYATEEVNSFDGASIVLSDKLTEIGQVVTAEAALIGDPEMDADYITWSVDDSTVVEVSKNKDGSASLKALKDGSATLTYTYNDGSVSQSLTKTVVVATTPVTDFSGTDLGLDLDTYEYITWNVTNTTDEDLTFTTRCRVTLPGATSKTTVTLTATVPAGAENMDIWQDLTETENWEGTLYTLSYTSTAIPDGVTVNNTKLWAKLNTEPGLKFSTDSEFIGYANYTLNVAALTDCDLEGVYDLSYTWTTKDVTNNCATVTEQADGSINVVSNANAEGFVTLTATCTSDPSISITKKIFVKTTDETLDKTIIYKWDLEDSANTGWSIGGNHNQSYFGDGAVTLVKSFANVKYTDSNGAEQTGKQPVSVASSSSGYTLTRTTGGSLAESGANTTEFSMSDYPYFCFTAKSSNPGTYALKGYFTADGTSHSEAKTISKSVALTDEYQTVVMDVSGILSTIAGQNYGGIMFANTTESVIDTTNIDSSNVVSELNYTTYKPVTIDEFYFANYDPTVAENQIVGVNLTADKTTLTGEGTITLTSEVFSNVEITNTNVTYTADSDIVTVFDNGDGTATVTPVDNGTVTITATSVLDDTATDSVTLTISGVQKKIVAYDLSMISLGNSYLCHGYAEWFDKSSYNGWIDETDVIRGMAASEPDLDYYGRIQYYINENLNCSLKAHRVANSTVERSWMLGLADSSDITNLDGFNYVTAKNSILSALKEQLTYIENEQTNIITIQLAENAKFSSVHTEIAEFFYDTIFAAIDEVRPEESVVVVITTFGAGTASNAAIAKATEYGYCVANCTDMTDSKWKAYDQYPDFNNPNTTSDFRSHPGDLGMDEIGKRVFAQLETAIPANITASYIYVPDSISITGGNAITVDEGTLALSIAATPSENSTTSVTWSVDNENVATIDEDGVLTAKNNGTVKVTAVCAYDSSITATLDVTVSGQVQAYTLTYAGGTVDTVTKLPAADSYAKGEYTLSTSAPERNGYKFKGWSLTAGGTPVKTVTMDSDKTVYATWEFATAWEFDTEGDLEGIGLGGFHTYCRYEEVPGMVVATVTYYNNSPVTIYDNTLLVPSDDYNEFAVRLQASDTTSEDKLNLTLTNDAGTKYEYSLPMTSAAMTEYVFDISDVEGTITGFILEPTFVEIILYIDYIRFQKGATKVEVAEDTTVDSLTFDGDLKLDAGDYTYTVTSAVTVPADTTLYLEAGTYVFEGDLTGDVVASPNANVIVEGTNKPEGYVEIAIGAPSGTRYAEIDGVQLEIKENDDYLYGVIASKNLLIQIVDKSGASLVAETQAESTTTRYFHVNVSDATYEELPMGSYMQNHDGQEIRLPDEELDNMPGLRFKAQVTTASKKATEYQINEYGYIIGLEETLDANGEDLTFESVSAYVSGKAFVRGEYDTVFDSSSDTYHIFTGVLYGAPEDQYAKNLVAKTYTKVTVGSDDYIIYGEPMVANFFDIAKALKAEGGLSEEAEAIVDEIISKATGPDIGFDWGEL